DNVQPLLDLWNAAPADDTHLIHLARMALRNQLVRPGGFENLPGDEKLVNVAMGAKTAQWAAFVLGWLKSKGGDWPRSLQHVVRYISPDALPAVFDLARTLESKPAREQLSIIRGVQQGCQERGMKLPDPFSAWAQTA